MCRVSALNISYYSRVVSMKKVCVCVYERGREGGREREKKREREYEGREKLM